MYLDIDRKRNSQINRSSPANMANQSSEKVEKELMEHGYVTGRMGTMGLMKLSKVVVHNSYIIKGLTCNNFKVSRQMRKLCVDYGI